jgi:DNA mismatch repair protein MutL
MKPVVSEIQPAVYDEKASVSFGEVYGDNDVFVNSTVVGQLFDTYIVLQYRDQLVLLDQHAAHERLMYEKIKKSLEETENESQMLLTPVAIQLAPSEFASFKTNSEFFTKAGFEIEEFGVNTISVRSVPMILAGTDVAEFIVSGIKAASQGKEKAGLFTDNAIYTMACKAAIKANHRLREEEIFALLKDLAEVKNPGTCPHGRPIIVKYTKYEIERKFHRC